MDSVADFDDGQNRNVLRRTVFVTRVVALSKIPIRHLPPLKEFGVMPR